RQEYESRITALCKRLQHLESEVGDAINRPEGSRLAQVERQLAKQTELYSEQSSRTSKLQFEYNKVLNDYNAQLETVDMINQEVKALLMEVKTQKQRNQDTEDELQQAYDRIKNLEDENSDLKADLDDTRRDLDDTRRDMDDTRRDLDDLKQDLKKAEDEAVSARSAAKEAAAVAAASATSVTPAPSVPPTPSAAPAAPMNSSSFGGPKDYMNNHHVNESQHHQDMGLANTSNNLNNLNTIVNSVTGSNNNSNNNSNNISSNISSNISNISSTLNNSNNILNSNVSSAPANTTTSSSTATTTNNNSNNINNNNSNNKDANDDDDSWSQDRQQARDSVMANPTSVIHLDTLNSFRNAVDDLLAAGRSDSSSSVLLGMKSVVIACKAVTEDVDDYELDEPQDDSFADLKQELSSGLSQLMSAAKAHSNNFDEDEDEFDRTLTDLETSADQLEAIVMDIVNVTKRTRGGKMDGGSGGMNNKGYKEKGGRDDVDDEDDMPRKGLNDNKAHKTKLDEPMDALDLK
ncbi:component of the polarisome, partial [Lunasporangiospora selenospora]